MANRTSNPDPTASERTCASLTELARTLAYVSYKVTEDSGDYRHKGNGGRRGCYARLWEDVYQFVYFAAFFALSDERQRDPAVRRVAGEARKTYNKTLSDKHACHQAYLEPIRPTQRLGQIRVHDGARLRRPSSIAFDEILRRMKAEGFLTGWSKGLPAHLKHRVGAPVMGGVVSVA